ncbi:glycosyltransferase [Hutsoniella sourekii]
MKKVLIVTFTMEVGGLENVLMNIIRNIDRNRFQVDIVVNPTEKKSDNLLELESNGINIFYISTPGSLGPYGYINNLRRIIRENGPYDVIHANNEYHGGLVAVAGKLENIPIRIVHSHTSSTPTVLNKILLPVYKTIISLFSTKNLAVSKEAGHYLFYKKFSILKNGQDIEKIQKLDFNIVDLLRKEFKPDSENYIIGHVGRLSPEKNQMYLLEIAEKLKLELNNQFKILIIGDGPLKSEIQKEIIQRNLVGVVELLGEKKDVYEYMYIFDCLLQPSFYEGLPLVVLEAQGVGTTTIVSSGIPESANINYNLFYRVDLEQIDEWIGVILKTLIDQPINKREDFEEIHESFKREGLDISSMIKQLEDYYEGKS